jgi:hypothetical protein
LIIDILADDDKRDAQQQQQQQEAEHEEQGEHGHDSSGNGDNNDQDSDDSGPLSGASCLAPQGIAPWSVSASVAFDSLRIAVRYQYKHPSMHCPNPRGAPPVPPSVMRNRRPTRGQISGMAYARIS